MMGAIRSATAVGFLAASILGTACSGGGKCEQAVDKALKIIEPLAMEMTKSLGGKAENVKKKMAKEKPKAVKTCQENLQKNKANTEKALDCIMAAKDMGELQKCGAGDFMGGVIK